jgi:hypothetical protein
MSFPCPNLPKGFYASPDILMKALAHVPVVRLSAVALYTPPAGQGVLKGEGMRHPL